MGMGRGTTGGNVTERPILFSGPMVRAVLGVTKTQTRRVVRGVDECAHGYDAVKEVDGQTIRCAGGATLTSPFGVPGDRLWVRETFKPHPPGTGRTRPSAAIYRADYQLSEGPGPWKPAIHMPRWACRLVLDVVAARAERLQDISEADAIAEGVHHQPKLLAPNGARILYVLLWNSLNAKRGYGWATNPWVWVIEFRRVNG